MKVSTKRIIENLTIRFPTLNPLKEDLENSVDALIKSFLKGGTLFVCGNGGSCSDSAHITGELVKSFCAPRKIREVEQFRLLPDGDLLKEKLQRGLPCIDLTANIALQTAIANDSSADLIFAQQLYVYGHPGDVLLALSTSGNSRNVYMAAQVANLKKITVIGLQGENKFSKLSKFADHLIAVPEVETYKVQELHLPIYHAICLCLENDFFGEG